MDSTSSEPGWMLSEFSQPTDVSYCKPKQLHSFLPHFGLRVKVRVNVFIEAESLKYTMMVG